MNEKSSPKFKLSESKRALLDALLKEEQIDSSAKVSIPRRQMGGPAQLSFAQERMWFMYQLDGGSGTYNVPAVLRLTGNLEVGALERSLNQVIRRHEVLRTTFAVVDGEPRQMIVDELALRLPLVDLAGLPEAERQEEMRNQAIEEGRRPFDLIKGPLIRFVLFRLDELEHILVIVFHHSIFDEWSQEVFYRDLGVFYRGQTTGQAVDLPELPIQYADFAVWQRQWLQGDVGQDQLDYWRQKLESAPAALNLHADHPRPPVQSYQGRSHWRRLPAGTSQALRRLCREARVTSFSALLAAFHVFLYRYTGQEQVLVGSPIANRRWMEVENMIGFFLNTLVMRGDLSGNPSFREMLKRVSVTVLEAFDHQDLPFERLVEALKPARDLSRHPLFQIAFVLHPVSLQKLELPGLQAQPIELDFGWAKFDLTLSLTEDQDSIQARMEYSTDLFEATTIERMLGHFEVLLGAILADPDRPILSLPLLTQAERQQALVGWNNTQRPYPRDRCAHQLFEEQVERTPQALAVVFGDQELTYRQLNVRANQAAHHLIEMGVQPGALVGLCMQRSAQMVVGMLAILKAGGAYVPLDPSYPQERLALMVRDSGAGVVLSQGGWSQVILQAGAQVVSMEDWPAAPDEARAANPPNRNQADDLAYVMYTSGSTGEPKGTGIPHRAINRLVINTDYVKLSPEDRIAQASNASFDAATFEVWGALLNGARLVGVDQDTVLSPAAYAQHIRETGINVMFVTTSLFNQIVATEPDAFSTVRDLMVGGEALAPEWIRRVLEVGPPKRLLNAYGPTESTTFASWELIEHVEAGAKSIPIGRPIANTQLYVLDRGLNLAPVGVAGELYIGGDGLALGYHRRPALTAERFVPDPFSGEGRRLYRTGDLARYLADGRIEFLGRIDHQVKLRGFRIELGEIEVILSEHPAVMHAAVLMREDKPGDKRLAAYLALERGARLDATELRSYLRAKLPEYMLPSAFVFLDELPLNPNGKVDREALPAPAAERTDAAGAYLAPRDDLEKRMCQMWEEVLGVHPVGIRDDFFELGGHSLLAVRLFNRIEQELGRRLPLAVLFHFPTVEELVLALRQAQGDAEWSALVPIQPRGGRPPLFLVHPFAGEVLRYVPLAQRLAPDQPVYGLQALGLRSGDEPHTTIVEMARYYTEAVRAHQPHGPYFLGGYCLGGVVAYEMARQLQAQGEAVGLVALIESTAPVRIQDRRLQRVANFVRNFPFWLHDFLRLNARDIGMAFRRRFKIIGKGFAKRLGGQEQAQITPLDLVGEQISHYPEHQRKLMEVHLQALMDYHPQDYAGRVTLFQVRTRSLFKYRDRDDGWGQLAFGGVTIRKVAGTHHDLVDEPQVQSLAEEIKDCLEAAFESGR